MEKNGQYIHIPEQFYRSDSGKKHDHCVLCEDQLFNYEQGYVIEKAFQKNPQTGFFETVFEYAVCRECQQKLSGEMSQESVLNIQRYFIENALQTDTFSDIFSDTESRFKYCMVKGMHISTMNEYQIGGLFKKELMVVNETFPYVIGEVAINEIQNLLSEKTKGFINKFKDLVIPPDVRKKIPDKPFIFL